MSASAAALSVDEALARILARLRPTAAVHMSLEHAIGHALADDVHADITLPPWANAGMDGYAVQRADVLGASAASRRTVRVTGTIAAGSNERYEVVPGSCVRIMTGARMPPGADAVVRVEDTDRGLEQVAIHDDRDAQSPTGNARLAGEDVRDGDRVAQRGDVITPSLLGVLASVGVSAPLVHRTPRIVVAASGNELVNVEAFERVRAGTAIVSSSSYALPALLRASGAEVRVLPLIPDDAELMRDALGSALESDCDLLVTTGGVSAGAFDHVRDVITSLGGRIDVPRVRVRPGGPLGAGHVLGTPWIGLPGNPVSTLVAAELFVRPAVRALAGQSRIAAERIPVRLAEDVSAPAPLRFYLRATLAVATDGAVEARLTGRQGSNLATSMARAHALLEIEGPTDLLAGTTVRALLLDDGLLRAVAH